MQIAEKYLSLARDALASGDMVAAESYFQHAEHYNRIIMAFRAQGITAAADSARVGMLMFQIGSVTIQARGSKAEVTGPSAITMPTPLIKPIPPRQTRMEPIRRANAPRGFRLTHKGENLHLHVRAR
jgi:hypothetical protein